MSEVSAVLAIAQRDILKFLRDPARMVATFVFPLIFIGALGGSLQATFGRSASFNLLVFTFLYRVPNSDPTRSDWRSESRGESCLIARDVSLEPAGSFPVWGDFLPRAYHRHCEPPA